MMIIKNKVVFSAIFSTCVVHTKTTSVKVVTIYLTASQLGKYQTLFTSTSENNN